MDIGTEVYRIGATGIFRKGWHLIKYQPYAVWRRQGARVALLRCPIPHDGGGIVLYGRKMWLSSLPTLWDESQKLI